VDFISYKSFKEKMNWGGGRRRYTASWALLVYLRQPTYTLSSSSSNLL